MRQRLLAPFLAVLLLAITGPAAAVTIDWVTVGDPGNAADAVSNCYAASCGSVAHSHRISR